MLPILHIYIYICCSGRFDKTAPAAAAVETAKVGAFAAQQRLDRAEARRVEQAVQNDARVEL